GKLTGRVIGPNTNKEITPLTNVEESEKSVKVYFTAEGYDVNLTMQEKDEDHVTGNILDMFEATGERVK
ncbi:MAG: hypothetical protein M3142_10650, partial [Bacteroidota bacterium]|nr:hypothetical protein [Bacteroidota bacterium]